ncbi:MAG: CBS domain-containing protein, partial [Pseudomonadota bacterium]
TLMKQADVHLLIPALGEACGYGMVPSISTTLTLAMGDALAIALMKHRSFTKDHFRDFHPGGKLGARLSKVRDLMHDRRALPLVTADSSMADTLLVMSEKGFGVAGVVGNGTLIGIVTDGDIRRNLDGLLERSTHDVMTANPLTISPDALAEKAIAVMNQRKITALFVTNADRKALGLIHIHDCLRAGLG